MLQAYERLSTMSSKEDSCDGIVQGDFRTDLGQKCSQNPVATLRGCLALPSRRQHHSCSLVLRLVIRGIFLISYFDDSFKRS